MIRGHQAPSLLIKDKGWERWKLLPYVKRSSLVGTGAWHLKKKKKSHFRLWQAIVTGCLGPAKFGLSLASLAEFYPLCTRRTSGNRRGHGMWEARLRSRSHDSFLAPELGPLPQRWEPGSSKFGGGGDSRDGKSSRQRWEYRAIMDSNGVWIAAGQEAGGVLETS